MCVFVSLFSTEIQTPGWIGMKFCTEVVLKGRKVLRGFRLGTPTPSGSKVPLKPQPSVLAKTL